MDCGAACDSDDDCDSGVCLNDCTCLPSCEIVIDSYSCEYNENTEKWVLTAEASWNLEVGDHAHISIECFGINGPYYYSPFTRSVMYSNPGTYSIQGIVHDVFHFPLCYSEEIEVECVEVDGDGDGIACESLP